MYLNFRLYLGLARNCYAVQQCPRLQWLMSPYGYRYFISHYWVYGVVKPTIFTCLTDTSDPLAYVARVKFIYTL